jgi:hypothetical protein
VQITAGAQPKRNCRLRVGHDRCSELPRFGMSTKRDKAARIAARGGIRTIEIRAPGVSIGAGGMQLSSCIHQQSAGDCKGWVLFMPRGVNSSEAWPRSQFARQRSCAHRASWGLAPDFAALYTRLRRGPPLRTRSPCCSMKWSADSPKRCSAQTIFQRSLSTPSRPGAPSSRKPRLRRAVVAEAKTTALWELRTLFGPRGSPPRPLEDLPAEVRAGLFSMFGAGPDGNSQASAATFSTYCAGKRFSLHLTTPREAGT